MASAGVKLAQQLLSGEKGAAHSSSQMNCNKIVGIGPVSTAFRGMVYCARESWLINLPAGKRVAPDNYKAERKIRIETASQRNTKDFL